MKFLLLIFLSLNVFADEAPMTTVEAVMIAHEIQEKPVRTNEDTNKMKNAVKQIIKNAFPVPPSN